MKLTIDLVDRNRKKVKSITVKGDLAKQVAEATIIKHDGKYYSYSCIRVIGKAEFMECNPVLEVPNQD